MNANKKVNPLTLPIPFYLQMASFHYVSSAFAFAHVKHGLPNWNPNCVHANETIKQFAASPLGKLLEPLANVNNAEPILVQEGLKRFEQFLLGLKIYLEAPLTLNTPSERILWREGTTVMRNYGKGKTGDKPLVLFVPSLINRANILDLIAGYSMLDFMGEHDTHPVLLDWQSPGETEAAFSLDEYVARIARAVTVLHDEYDKPVILAGYCMGGLLSLATAQLFPARIQGLALLATPWDFIAPDVARTAFSPAGAEQIASLFASAPLVPNSLLYTIFYSLNPWGLHDKFRRLASLDTHDPVREVLLAR